MIQVGMEKTTGISSQVTVEAIETIAGLTRNSLSHMLHGAGIFTYKTGS